MVIFWGLLPNKILTISLTLSVVVLQSSLSANINFPGLRPYLYGNLVQHLALSCVTSL